jgi:hypothetical protein
LEHLRNILEVVGDIVVLPGLLIGSEDGGHEKRKDHWKWRMDFEAKV